MHSRTASLSRVQVLLLVLGLWTLSCLQQKVIAFQTSPPPTRRRSTQQTETSQGRNHPTHHGVVEQYSNGVASRIPTGKSPLFSSSSSSSKATVQGKDTNTHNRAESSNIPADVVVIGGGPAGLLTCIMLAQTFCNDDYNNNKTTTIHLYESAPTPPAVDDVELWETDVARFYSLGVFGRGRKALQAFGVWDQVQSAAVEMKGSQRWDPKTGKPILSMLKDRGRESVFALPRDKLVSVLHEHILEHYTDQIRLNFGCHVNSIDLNDGTKPPVVTVTRTNAANLANNKPSGQVTDVTFRVTADLLVGADGAARSVANEMEKADQKDYKKKTEHLNFLNKIVRRIVDEKPFRVKRYVDDNKRVYKTIALQLPDDWRHDLGYQNNSRDGKYAIVTLPSAEGGKQQCAVLLLRAEDPLAKSNTDAKDLRDMLIKYFPQFNGIIGDEEIERVAQKPPSNFPLFRYAGPRLHYGSGTVILGDAIHTVKPYNGLGVNTAFEDVHILGNILDRTQNIPDTIQEFSERRADDAKAVVRISRAQDRPGKLFFLSFVLPIIVDSFFHKWAPKLFAPPTNALVQDDNYSFHQIASRKRLDRIMQASVIGVLATCTVKIAIAAFKRIVLRSAA